MDKVCKTHHEGVENALFAMLLDSPEVKGLINALLFQIREREVGWISIEHPYVSPSILG